MGSLNEHFRQSGYTLHRAALRRERLPRCCRENLHALTTGIKFMDEGGGELLLPLTECVICGRKYAMSDEKYIVVKNLLQFDVVKI